MKKYMLFIIFIVMFNINVVYADEMYIKIVYGTANMRSSNNTSSTLLGSYDPGEVLKLLDTERSGNWYHVENDKGDKGYISSNYSIPFLVYEKTSTALNTCETEMYKAGFTDASYYPYLCYMKMLHPEWVFTAQNVNMDFDYAVDKESQCGMSYISSSDASDIDKSCTNLYDSGWYPASNSAVAYYMDPRNFLGENYVFMFENLSYDTNLESTYQGLVYNTILDTSFYTYHKKLGNNIDSLITSAGKTKGMNPVSLASRIRTEMGTGTSLYNLYSGVYTGYEGYYNFINWGVTDSCATTSGASICGLEKAKSMGWSSLSLALEGAANSIASNYINANQETLYLQKYNVNQPVSSDLFTHQYMTNIKAPATEAQTTYSSHADSNTLNNPYSFLIPVYSNMDAEINNENAGASGGTADDGLSGLSISTIVTNSGHTYSSGYIGKVPAGTTVTEILAELEGAAGKSNVVIKDKDNKELSSGLIKTGDKITITNSIKSETLEVVVLGDVSGDGEINALDLLMVQKNILGIYDLVGAYKKAADTSGDGDINALDLLQVQKSILGTYKIE